ncbi:hypothetical protein MRX96_045119 [Rhipicephalus microplus]
MTKKTKPKGKTKALFMNVGLRPPPWQPPSGTPVMQAPLLLNSCSKSKASLQTAAIFNSKQQEANSAASDHAAPVFSMTVSSNNTSGIPALDPTEDRTPPQPRGNKYGNRTRSLQQRPTRRALRGSSHHVSR